MGVSRVFFAFFCYNNYRLTRLNPKFGKAGPLALKHNV